MITREKLQSLSDDVQAIAKTARAELKTATDELEKSRLKVELVQKRLMESEDVARSLQKAMKILHGQGNEPTLPKL